MKRPERIARGYDLYGNIAVIGAPPAAAKTIGKRLMRENSNVRTVLRKGGPVRGRYRTRDFIYVAGERNYLADYRENGCRFVFDIRKTFFSTRLAYERKRISGLVKDGERVVVMFAGAGPYAIEMARTHKKCRVIAIELNKSACVYMRKSILLNKVKNVTVEQGDVRRFADKYEGWADRIVMPLPQSASRFLQTAIKMCGSRCTIHYYAFCKSEDTREAISNLRKFFAGRKKKFRLLGSRVVRPYSSREIELAVDFTAS